MPSKREKKRKVQSNKVRLTHFTNTRIRQIIGWGAVALGIVIISFSVLIALEPSWIRSIPYIGKAFAYAETVIKGPKLPDTAGLYGIDVSKHQGNIHWDEVELRYDMVTRRISKHGTMQAPLTFAIAKATEGITTTDPMFELNKKGIRERNIILGAYHYFSYLSDAKKQAEKYLQVAKLAKGDLVPIIDIEEDGNLIKLLKNKKLTKQKVKENVLLWLRTAEEKTKAKPIIYTSPSYKAEYLDSPEFDKYTLWIAHYQVSEPKLKGAMWQFTERGAIKGISTNVDINLFCGTKTDLQQLMIK